MTKIQLIEKQLSRKSGASLSHLMKVTGWQAHSVRAALSRLRKTGWKIERGRNKRAETVYRAAHGRKQP